jgi:membrane protease YdiL (CAAX protease family)
MNESEIPPIIGAPETQPRRAKWRWAIHLFLLAAYVLSLGLAGAFVKTAHTKENPAMPGDLGSLARFCAFEFILFGIIFGIAWLFSRARVEDLFLKWRGGARPIAWGIAYSILLRLVIMMVLIAVAVPTILFKGKESVENFRPKTEAIVNMPALKDPAYLIFTLTVVSFVVAGFREELWRAGILAGLAGIAPRIFSSRTGQLFAVAIGAIIFGLGHLPQGPAGVAITTALGFGLGVIIVRHQSIWEAVLAHGFFDATTFAGIYLIAKYFPEALRGLAISG